MLTGTLLLKVLENAPQIIESLKGLNNPDANKLVMEIEQAQTVWQEWK